MSDYFAARYEDMKVRYKRGIGNEYPQLLT